MHSQHHTSKQNKRKTVTIWKILGEEPEYQLNCYLNFTVCFLWVCMGDRTHWSLNGRQGPGMTWRSYSSIQLPEETAGSEIVGSPSRESVDGKRCSQILVLVNLCHVMGKAISVESHPVDTEHIFSCLWFRDKLSVYVCMHTSERTEVPNQRLGSIHIWGTSRIRDFWRSEYCFLLVNFISCS